MNNEIYNTLASIRQQYEDDALNQLLHNLYVEEDLMELTNPRNFGPDWDENV
jgi:hypothetical protein